MCRYFPESSCIANFYITKWTFRLKRRCEKRNQYVCVTFFWLKESIPLSKKLSVAFNENSTSRKLFILKYQINLLTQRVLCQRNTNKLRKVWCEFVTCLLSSFYLSEKWNQSFGKWGSLCISIYVKDCPWLSCNSPRLLQYGFYIIMAICRI